MSVRDEYHLLNLIKLLVSHYIYTSASWTRLNNEAKVAVILLCKCNHICSILHGLHILDLPALLFLALLIIIIFIVAE